MLFFALIFIIFWLGLLFNSHRSLSNLKQLTQLHSKMKKTDYRYPLISIVIAVRDGETELENTLIKLLNSDYSPLEIIIVNDRSKDKTQSIIEKIQLLHPNLLSIKIHELPNGWLGKVNALHQGMQIAKGEFLLFMDADILVSKKVLETAIFTCDHYKLNHLGVVPNFLPGGFWLNVSINTSEIMFCNSAKPWIELSKRPNDNARGVGAFNLVKRDFFLKTEGFNWLKMDVADDVALALLIAKNGGKSMIAKAHQEGPDVLFYENFTQLVLGLEKNIVGGLANYKISIILMIAFASFAILTLPIYCLFHFHHNLIFLCGILFYLSTFLFALKYYKKLNRKLFEVVLFPYGLVILGLILIRSSYICFKNGGITWRGTFYPLEELIKGSRVKFNLF